MFKWIASRLIPAAVIVAKAKYPEETALFMEFMTALKEQSQEQERETCPNKK
jgi:hypothetical protein